MVFVPVSCAAYGSTISTGGRKRYVFSGPRVANGISIHLRQRELMSNLVYGGLEGFEKAVAVA
jgi:hypothetical protein